MSKPIHLWHQSVDSLSFSNFETSGSIRHHEKISVILFRLIQQWVIEEKKKATQTSFNSKLNRILIRCIIVNTMPCESHTKEQIKNLKSGHRGLNCNETIHIYIHITCMHSTHKRTCPLSRNLYDFTHKRHILEGKAVSLVSGRSAGAAFASHTPF